MIILTDGGEFKLVGRAGDPGDVPVTGEQSFILTAQRAARIDISGGGGITPPQPLPRRRWCYRVSK